MAFKMKNTKLLFSIQSQQIPLKNDEIKLLNEQTLNINEKIEKNSDLEEVTMLTKNQR